MAALIGITQEIITPAINVLAGDVFTRHGRTWTARYNARHEGRWTARVATETGTVWLSTDEEIIVRRVVKRRRSEGMELR